MNYEGLEKIMNVFMIDQVINFESCLNCAVLDVYVLSENCVDLGEYGW